MINLKAATPVPYIIALIIGIIVVAVLAYWFITSGKKGSDVSSEVECTARKAEWCVTQTSTAETAADKVCLADWKSKRAEFCGAIIPGWRKT